MLLEAGDPAGPPRRGLTRHPTDGHYYYLTAIPVPLNNRPVGAVIVGTPLDTLAGFLRRRPQAAAAKTVLLSTPLQNFRNVL